MASQSKTKRAGTTKKARAGPSGQRNGANGDANGHAISHSNGHSSSAASVPTPAVHLSAGIHHTRARRQSAIHAAKIGSPQDIVAKELAKGPLRINLGCGNHPTPGWLNLDVVALPGVQLVWDLENLPYPIPDGCVERIEASHVLEHVLAFMPLMEELHRILAPGGILHVKAPYYKSTNAFDDPTHVRFFTERTMDYFDPAKNEYAFYSEARFRVKSLKRNRTGGFPRYHLRKYLHLPAGKVWELEWELERI